MATPDKKMKMLDDTETVNGYLHEVSPMKYSRNNVKYFNAIIQEKDKYTNSVCFRPEFHQNMVQLQKQRSQVSLRKVDRVPSLQRSGDFDIKITYSSDLSTPKKSLDFDFQPPPSQNQVQTINHIKESLNAYQKTNVHVKVVQIGQVQTKTVRSGTSVSCQDVVVADKTGSITLCVWDKQTDTYSIEESYSMQNISVRNYDNINLASSKKLRTVGKIIMNLHASSFLRPPGAGGTAKPIASSHRGYPN
ncbi:hypothetical protein FSP39_017591 [Pinctada imbricata]|uniref:Uncharacterized protein n=1 Tax=Pinctada imbricata TaxID=66713 RepID=A0AA88YU22_PINIB|nr:hypothetical protein FSP39_017591 [Pinctada imbricata]